MRKFAYTALAALGVVLTAMAARYAYADRGYFAIGGEYAFLMLPLFGAVVDCIWQGHAGERKHHG